jgi:outer membrane lipoprotein-sorting protein
MLKLAFLLLVLTLLVSGCTQQDSPGDRQDTPLAGEDPESLALDQLEQELEKAIEDIDLGDLETEMLQ